MRSRTTLLGSFLVLAATVDCGGSREDPVPVEDGTPFSTATEGNANGGNGTGGAGTGGNGTGGIPSTGGNGTGGMGTSTGTSTGTGGMGTGGMGTGGNGQTANEVDAIFPFCGCISDSHEPGACGDCIPTATMLGGTCAGQDAGCASGCQAMYTALQSCDPIANPGCLDAVYNMAPLEWDDLVALVSCECTACPAPNQCDAVACQ